MRTRLSKLPSSKLALSFSPTAPPRKEVVGCTSALRGNLIEGTHAGAYQSNGEGFTALLRFKAFPAKKWGEGLEA